jgi:hypothetical protein
MMVVSDEDLPVSLVPPACVQSVVDAAAEGQAALVACVTTLFRCLEIPGAREPSRHALHPQVRQS